MAAQTNSFESANNLADLIIHDTKHNHLKNTDANPYAYSYGRLTGLLGIWARDIPELQKKIEEEILWRLTYN